MGCRVAGLLDGVVLTLIVFDIFGLGGIFVDIEEDAVLGLESCSILVAELTKLIHAGLELALVIDTQEVAEADLFVGEEEEGALEVDTALAGVLDEFLVVGFGLLAIVEHLGETLLQLAILTVGDTGFLGHRLEVEGAYRVGVSRQGILVSLVLATAGEP